MTGVACLPTYPGSPGVHRKGGDADDSLRNHYGCYRDIGLAHIFWWLHRCIYRLSR